MPDIIESTDRLIEGTSRITSSGANAIRRAFRSAMDTIRSDAMPQEVRQGSKEAKRYLKPIGTTAGLAAVSVAAGMAAIAANRYKEKTKDALKSHAESAGVKLDPTKDLSDYVKQLKRVTQAKTAENFKNGIQPKDISHADYKAESMVNRLGRKNKTARRLKAMQKGVGRKLRRQAGNLLFGDIKKNENISSALNIQSSLMRTSGTVLRHGTKVAKAAGKAIPGYAASVSSFAGAVRTGGLKNAVTSRINIKAQNAVERVRQLGQVVKIGGGLDWKITKHVQETIENIQRTASSVRAGATVARSVASAAANTARTQGTGALFKQAGFTVKNKASGAAKNGAKSAVNFLKPGGGLDTAVTTGKTAQKVTNTVNFLRPGGGLDKKAGDLIGKIGKAAGRLLRSLGALLGGVGGGTFFIAGPILLLFVLIFFFVGILSGSIIGSDDGGDYLSVEQVMEELELLHGGYVADIYSLANDNGYDNVEIIYPNGSQENYKECISALTVFTANDLEAYTANDASEYLTSIYNASHILYTEEYTYEESVAWLEDDAYDEAEAMSGVVTEHKGIRIYLTILRDDSMCYESLASYYGTVADTVSSSSNTYTSGDWMSIVSSVKEAIAGTGTGYSQSSRVSITMNGTALSVRPDCSGFVSACLQLYGSFNTGRTWSSSLFVHNSSLSGFTKHAWTGWDDLQEGDIIAYYDTSTGTGHVEVFAYNRGNTHYVYNCGSDSSVSATGVTTDARASYDVYWRCNSITSSLAKESAEEDSDDLEVQAYSGLLTSNTGEITYDENENEVGYSKNFLATITELKNADEDDFSLSYDYNGMGSMHMLSTEGKHQAANSMDFARLIYSEHGVTLGTTALSIQEHWLETEYDDLKVGDVMLWYAGDYVSPEEESETVSETESEEDVEYDESQIMVFIYTGDNDNGEANFVGYYYSHADGNNASICDVTLDSLISDAEEKEDLYKNQGLIGYYSITGILKNSVYGHTGYFGGWTDEKIVLFNSYMEDDDMWTENEDKAEDIKTVENVEEYTDVTELQAAADDANTPEYYVGYHEDDFADEELYVMSNTRKKNFIDYIASSAQYLCLESNNKILPSIMVSEAALLSDWGNSELASAYYNIYSTEYSYAKTYSDRWDISYVDVDYWSVDDDGTWTMETKRMASYDNLSVAMRVWTLQLVSDGTMDDLYFDLSYASNNVSWGTLLNQSYNLYYINGYNTSKNGSLYMLTGSDSSHSNTLISYISHNYLTSPDVWRLKELDTEVLVSSKAKSDSKKYRGYAYSSMRDALSSKSSAAGEEAKVNALVPDAQEYLSSVKSQTSSSKASAYLEELEALLSKAKGYSDNAAGYADTADSQASTTQSYADFINNRIINEYMMDGVDRAYYEYSSTSTNTVVMDYVEGNYTTASEYASTAEEYAESAQASANAAEESYNNIKAMYEEAAQYVKDLEALEAAQDYYDRIESNYSNAEAYYNNAANFSRYANSLANSALSKINDAADEIDDAYDAYEEGSYGSVLSCMGLARTNLTSAKSNLTTSSAFLSSASSNINALYGSCYSNTKSYKTKLLALSAKDEDISEQIKELQDSARDLWDEMYGTDGFYATASNDYSAANSNYNTANRSYSSVKGTFNKAVTNSSMSGLLCNYGGIEAIN